MIGGALIFGVGLGVPYHESTLCKDWVSAYENPESRINEYFMKMVFELSHEGRWFCQEYYSYA